VRTLIAPLALLSLACVTPGGVTLDAYRGALLTHFGGIPEGSRICGWLTNQSGHPVAWVRLRLVATTGPEGDRERNTSTWLLADTLAPGERAAFELPDPPLADAIQLRVTQSGQSADPARAGRRARRIPDCSEPWMQALLAAESESRPTADLASTPLDRPDAPVPADLLAEQP
jgi:hypothetical protein